MLEQPPLPALESVELDRKERRGFSIGTLVAWLVVALIEVVPLPDKWLGAFIVPPMEVVIWLVAVALTIRNVHKPVVLRLIVALVVIVAMVWANNWSLYDPRSYYRSHRPGFAAVGTLVNSGRLDGRLPWYLADLSTTGSAQQVGTWGGWPVMLLPERISVDDVSSGYVYVLGPITSTTTVDLGGSTVCVCDGLALGDGWYYVRP